MSAVPQPLFYLREKDIRNYCGWILRCWDNENKSMEGMKMLAYDLALGRNGWGKNMDQAFLVINDAIDMDPEDPENYDTKGYFLTLYLIAVGAELLNGAFLPLTNTINSIS